MQAQPLPAAVARINLQKLGHTNKLNAAATNPSDALKDAAHSAIGSNISDPDWKKSQGIVRLGGLNVVGYSFGRFDNTGLNYVALHQLQSGRELFCRVNLARANQYVKIPGKLFLAIYNNQRKRPGLDTRLEPVASVRHHAGESCNDRQYRLHGRSRDRPGRNDRFSDILTIANAPDDTAMAAGVRVAMSWTYYAGVIRATVYRRRLAGNVFKMESFSTGANSWTDTNLSTRIDTGSASFPVFTNSTSAIPSYWGSADSEFDNLLYDGELRNGVPQYWAPIQIHLPFSPSVNMGTVFDPYFVMGLTARVCPHC
jgi:hypothetical protein